MSAPETRWTSKPADPKAVVLVLHGGAEASTKVNHWWNLHVLRLLPFANKIKALGGDGLAIARLLFPIKGWNDNPIAHAQWALGQLRETYPGRPIGVIGHSMGGRVALALLDEKDVTAVCALAPWVAREDVARGGPGDRVLIMHGTFDHITSPKASQHMTGALQARGVDATYEPLQGVGHPLLRRAGQIHREAATWLTNALLTPKPAGSPAPDEAPATDPAN